jgi:hypothetical protein
MLILQCNFQWYHSLCDISNKSLRMTSGKWSKKLVIVLLGSQWVLEGCFSLGVHETLGWKRRSSWAQKAKTGSLQLAQVQEDFLSNCHPHLLAEAPTSLALLEAGVRWALESGCPAQKGVEWFCCVQSVYMSGALCHFGFCDMSDQLKHWFSLTLLPHYPIFYSIRFGSPCLSPYLYF